MQSQTKQSEWMQDNSVVIWIFCAGWMFGYLWSALVRYLRSQGYD